MIDNAPSPDVIRASAADAAPTWVDNTTLELGAAWYPVAWSHEVTDAPVAVELLGRHWVLARIDGELAAFVDRCPHRLLPLSGGELCGATLRCAYHGWEFDRSGTAVRIPSLGDGSPIPPRARLEGPAGLVERFGAIWLAPEEPVAPLPDLTEWDDPRFECRLDIGERMTASAAQMMDNGCDTSHFFMVHRGTFGGDETAMSFPRSVERDGWTLTAVFETPYKVHDDPDVVAGRADPVFQSRQTKTFTLGMNVLLRMEFPATDSTFTVLMAAQPENGNSTRLFRWFCRDDIVGDEERWAACLEIEAAVLAEDISALGLFRDHRVPLDLTTEVHVKSDKLSLAYRRLLAEFVSLGHGGSDGAAG
jgi:phenylpropionate dioxygenase-like ring-hydroxylating dioxygenase large terminal subunit